ncbi:Asp23/Gls24 family envelope stress response protein [Paeniglutamicibacter terrestris]|uniref:Asp23/Gls24 family envelope stress response protein n=1 Tax=Paeniglutamicibacter terrestris TaxID=2723403 RepID=A0ABX1FZZ8_9MICC|nr:Asp23/Gls24 family envelope stress response protein [Paeniglutamicibacter terrestris]ASN38250.1 hypothetical protein CGQ24_03960 [Arthrobacter sp. 7749]NKG19537.1 Asp23/Gls24 family envelope stress response protein [Paeniglutamicibacter terrestris]
MIGDGTDPAQRGRLNIDVKVIQRIAAKAAARHPHVGASSGGLLGIGEKRDFGALPPVEVNLAGNIASVKLKVGIRFPADLRNITAEIRYGIINDLQRFTGVTAAPVDIDIQWLENAPAARRIL